MSIRASPWYLAFLLPISEAPVIPPTSKAPVIPPTSNKTPWFNAYKAVSTMKVGDMEAMIEQSITMVDQNLVGVEESMDLS